jgi:hypothetical protein
MSILDKLAVHIRNPEGDEHQSVPLANVLASHELMRAGCPVDQLEDCPPWWWSQLASERELRDLAEVFRKIESQVETLGGSLTLL